MRDGQGGLRPPILLVVAAAHIGCIAALCTLSDARHVPPPPDIAIPVIFAPAPSEPSPHMLEASTLPVPRSTATAALASLPAATVPADRRGELPRAAPRHPPRNQTHPAAASGLAPSAPSPPTAVAPVQPSTIAPPATSPHDIQPALESWEARIRQAVQDAALYPPSARLLHRDGRAQIRFDYDRGTIERASIAQSSHFEALDQAALAAVTRAAIPAPPAELGPQTRAMLVWVQFKLQTEE